MSIITDNTPSSAMLLNQQFTSLQGQGQLSLDNLSNISLGALLEIQRGLLRLNGYRCRANRVLATGLATAFHVSDLLDTDQAATTATIRADAQAVTLAERKVPGNVTVSSTVFSANTGSVEQFGDLYRVSTDGPAPIGTFNITLSEAVNTSFLVIDIAPTPSIPNISVAVSGDNLVYNQATNSSYNGYRVNVWLAPQEVKYIQVVFSPTHPDTLGGSSYTFGITDFSALAVQYQLSSDWYSLPITFAPTSADVMFLANAEPGIIYYLSVDGQVWQAVTTGQIIPIPGAVKTTEAMALPLTLSGEPNVNGQLDGSLPSNVYPTSIKVTSGNTDIPVVFGLPLGTRATTNQYMIIQQASNGSYYLYLLPCTNYNFGQTFNVMYTYGPSEITAYLRVHLSTEDKAVTPTFTGASLESV